MRTWQSDQVSAGEFLQEITGIVAAPTQPPLSAELDVPVLDVESGYALWAGTYDGGGNPLIAIEEPVMRGLIDELPTGHDGQRRLQLATTSMSKCHLIVGSGCQRRRALRFPSLTLLVDCIDTPSGITGPPRSLQYQIARTIAKPGRVGSANRGRETNLQLTLTAACDSATRFTSRVG